MKRYTETKTFENMPDFVPFAVDAGTGTVTIKARMDDGVTLTIEYGVISVDTVKELRTFNMDMVFEVSGDAAYYLDV